MIVTNTKEILKSLSESVNAVVTINDKEEHIKPVAKTLARSAFSFLLKMNFPDLKNMKNNVTATNIMPINPMHNAMCKIEEFVFKGSAASSPVPNK